MFVWGARELESVGRGRERSGCRGPRMLTPAAAHAGRLPLVAHAHATAHAHANRSALGRPGADRARRFRIAEGEAAECHAGLDLLEIRGELRGPALTELRALLERARATLWRLGRP